MPPMSFVKPSTGSTAAIVENIVTPTPVAGVVVESVNTVGPVGVTGPVGAIGNAGIASAVAVQPPMALTRTSGFVLGDKIPDFGDIVMPRINIAQNIGDLKDSFAPGSIVLNQETLLFSPQIIDPKTNAVAKAGTPPVTVTCLGFRPTRFAEYVKGGGKGMIVNTEAEVRANGGTTDYNEHALKAASGMKKFDPLAEAFMAIERPEWMADDGTVFCYPCNGKQYALALWAMKRTSYTAAAKGVFFTKRAMGCLREGGYPSYSFKLSTRWKPFGESNGAWIPVLIEPAKQPVEFLAWVTSVLNPSEAINTGAEE